MRSYYMSCCWKVLVALICIGIVAGVSSGSHTSLVQIIEGADRLRDNNPPPYPITAAWFRDRFSREEWDSALDEFRQQGGDTVLLRAPPIQVRSAGEILNDPNFKWCGSTKSPTGEGSPDCVTEAQQELTSMGLKVVLMATFQYEENFSKTIMRCPTYDRAINSSRLYYRLVLPLNNNLLGSCNFPAGTPVLVLFTSFAGVDPHALLAQSASKNNMTVYFGIPEAPRKLWDSEASGAYYDFITRIINEHKQRYTAMQDSIRSLWDSINGYFTGDFFLGDVHSDYKKTRKSDNSFFYQLSYVQIFTSLGKICHSVQKKFCIAPYINLNKAQTNATFDQHIQSYETLANTRAIDVIAVQEGRGSGRGCYYWDNERDLAVSKVDPVLDRVIHYQNPSIPKDVTFRDAFTASNQEVFRSLAAVRDIQNTNGIKCELWLIVEAFEFLRDNPCTPADRAGSGMAELYDRTSKSRIDRAITAAGFFPNKISTFAWDPDYTCRETAPVVNNQPNKLYSKQHVVPKNSTSLAEEIHADMDRTIVSNCSFHSPQNLSIVLIGYNVGGATQINWIDWKGRPRTSNVNGYYFEMDYGISRGLVSSLMYTQLWDLWPVNELKTTGFIKVTPEGANHACTFWYTCGDVPACNML